MRLDQRLVDAAIDYTNQRFPNQPYEGAAAMYTEDGEILISTAIEVVNEQASLCHEVGAICEAYTRNKRITATVCVSREPDGRACGICQERLWYWGGDVEVAVGLDDDSTRWRSVTLREMSPYYWRKAFVKGL